MALIDGIQGDLEETQNGCIKALRWSLTYD